MKKKVAPTSKPQKKLHFLTLTVDDLKAVYGGQGTIVEGRKK